VIELPTIAQIPAAWVIAVIIQCFKRFGMPRRIKVDNGRPLVDAKNRDLPTLALLWFIGLGIEVVQIPPRTPQQNGIVEGLQGTCSSWVAPAKRGSASELEEALAEMSTFQRDHYRIPAQKFQTRAQRWPELYQPLRPYDPQQFCFQLVKDHLAKQVWVRKIKKSGEIRFRGQEIYIGNKLHNQLAYITYDPNEEQWIIRDEKGMLIKTSTKALYKEQDIKEFANANRPPLTNTA